MKQIIGGPQNIKHIQVCETAYWLINTHTSLAFLVRSCALILNQNEYSCIIINEPVNRHVTFYSATVCNFTIYFSTKLQICFYDRIRNYHVILKIYG